MYKLGTVPYKNENMNVFISRFPHLIDNILKEVDNESLSKCRKIDRSLCDHIDQQKFFWVRRIQMYPIAIFRKEWNKTLKRTPVEIVERLVLVANDVFQYSIHRNLRMQFSPHQVAINVGNKFLYQYICCKTGKINPVISAKNVTTLHLATQVGDFEISRFIIDNIDNKNPRATSGVTPLHMAAKCGNLEVCKLIMATIDELIPGDNNGTTPLHEAAAQDYSEVCQFIIGKISRKNPGDNRGNTALHVAAKYGN